MNSADRLIYHASLLLDEGDLEGAMGALEDAIRLSEVGGFKLQLLRAHLLLGELLLGLDRHSDAMAQFQSVLATAPEVEDRTMIEDEVEAATAHLERLE